MLDEFKGRNVILLSQPMMEDCGLSEREMADVYADSIAEYEHDGIVVKPHPRDGFPFEKYFPNVKVVKTSVPMQLLCEIGAAFQTAITICSSSISSFPMATEIVWIGAAKNKKMLRLYGGKKPPDSFIHVRCCS